MGHGSSLCFSVIAHRYLGMELHVQRIIDSGMRLIDFKINSVTQNPRLHFQTTKITEQQQ
jgi:hypothetical protein